jgi:hypothetical protein
MKYVGIMKLGMVLCLLTLVGCGGGGGSSSTTPVGDTPQIQTTKINGTASKGPIIGGTVTAYKIVNNAKGDFIVSGPTGAGGSYSLDLGSYAGPVLLEISGGTYTDEATGNTTATIPVAAPLHAVVSSATGTVSVAITPLTDIAYQLAGSTLTAAAIDSANKQVSDVFNVSDIIKTQPVLPTKSTLDALPTTTQGQDQRDYTLALAAFSQVASTQSTSVADTVSYLKNNISGSTLGDTAATVVQNAVSTYFSPSNTKNTTGVTDPSSTNLVSIGAKQVIVKLSTAGTIPNGSSIKGIQFELNLPTGVSVKSDSSGVLASYLLTSGVALTATTPYISGNITGNKMIINFINGSGISTGEFATLTCDVAYNATVPTIGNFSISAGYKIDDNIKDVGTINLSAVTISVTSLALK